VCTNTIGTSHARKLSIFIYAYKSATTTLPRYIYGILQANKKEEKGKGRRMREKTESSNINMPTLIRPT